ncbi:MAG: hypothetical protein ABJN62_13155 [Halioglobus sp.]
MRKKSIYNLKIMGERNCGTNWAELLVKDNCDARLIHHRGILDREPTEFQKSVIREYSGLARAYAREQVRDSIFDLQGGDFLGWKHACPNIETLSKSELFDQTGILFFVRHPVTFIKSLHRRPYHALTKVSGSIDDFVNSPWVLTRRDNIPKPILRSPMDLWNYKVKSALELQSELSNFKVVKYESVLEDVDTLFDTIKSEFDVSRLGRVTIDKSAKGDDLTTGDYKKKYLNKKPSSDLSKEELKAIVESIDWDVAAQLNYDKI